MESSQVLKGAEECSSIESGWTKYIASPIQEDDYEDDDDDDDSTERGDDDDDSMASDASSGPSPRELPCASSEGSQAMGHFKHAEVEDRSKCSSGKKPRKQVVKKRDDRRMKVENQVSAVKANSATSHAQSGAKVAAESREQSMPMFCGSSFSVPT
ncbi:hypothetical protein L1049_005725 [Liquidambar formosana]|uniref:Uncharacterized protein n=1 Tax=Liquidambar formosana TaxID=63359 RepID=A0AAP0RER2_LIQFO